MRIEIAIQAIRSLEISLDVTLADSSQEKRQEIADRIFNEIERLSELPFLGQIEPSLQDLGLEYRRLVIGQFKVIYRIESEVIKVTDIFDSRRDPKQIRT